MPCKYLEQLVGQPVFRPLINRSGLNARVVVGGIINVGDVIRPCEPDAIDPKIREANELHGLQPPADVF